MQRRLTTAFALMAILSVLLLGSGMLTLSQISSRLGAEKKISGRLEAFIGEEDTNSAADIRRDFDAIRRVPQLEDVKPVIVDSAGTVSAIVIPPPRQRRPNPSMAVTPVVVDPGQSFIRRLDADEQKLLGQGKPVFISTRQSVTGLRTLSESQQAFFQLEEGSTIAVLDRERIFVIPKDGLFWYLISGLLVVILGVVTAAVLARRLARPLKEIQNATSAIARGRLDTRLTPRSNDEVGELALSVNQMAAELQRSKALDRQFLMSVSHDLRTPLTAMRGYGEALADRAIDDSAQAGEIIMHHADRLNRLVTDLLDLARLDSNHFQFDLQAANLDIIVGRSIAGLQESADRRSISLTLHVADEPLPVRVDIDRTNQVMTNLVHNAMKYARTSVSVVASLRSPDNQVEVVVKDDGPGIAPEDLPLIFDRLYTSRTRPVESENSNGLGLTIVKELVEAMGGTVAVDSPVNAGARFTVLFPCQPAAHRDDNEETTVIN